jgi:hypothetical protein
MNAAQVAINSRLFSNRWLRASEPRIQSKLGDGVTQLCPRGSILSFMPRSLSENALYHARANAKLPADLENAVATCFQF